MFPLNFIYNQFKVLIYYYLLERYSSIPFAAALPAPIARITVAAPVTASPPAYTASFDVCPLSSSATIHFLLLISSPLVVDEISGSGDVTSDLITASSYIPNSEPGISTGFLLPEASGSPSSIFTHLIPVTLPFSSVRTSVGLVRRSNIIPSSLA